MNSEEFAKAWKAEMETFLSDEYIAMKAEMLNIGSNELASCRRMLSEALSDAFYTLLLGLDGSASIGGVKMPYQIQDERGNIISDGGGALESAAWQQFRAGGG